MHSTLSRTAQVPSPHPTPARPRRVTPARARRVLLERPPQPTPARQAQERPVPPVRPTEQRPRAPGGRPALAEQPQQVPQARRRLDQLLRLRRSTVLKKTTLRFITRV